MRERYLAAAKEVQHHLLNELIPFWLTHGVDKEYGGYLTYLDSKGNPTGETDKTLICQTRFLYTASAAHRANLGDGKFLGIAKQGFDFLVDNFWDPGHTVAGSRQETCHTSCGIASKFSAPKGRCVIAQGKRSAALGTVIEITFSPSRAA